MVERMPRISRATVLEVTKGKSRSRVALRGEELRHNEAKAKEESKDNKAKGNNNSVSENKENNPTSIAMFLKKRKVDVQEPQDVSVRKSPRMTRSSAKLIEPVKEEIESVSVKQEQESTPKKGRKTNKKQLAPTIEIENEPENTTSEAINDVFADSTFDLSTESTANPLPIPTFSPFAEAKRAFHRSGSFKIVGRVEEKAAFSSFWYDSVALNKGASIYISGNPGTGKTALVDEMLAELMANDEGIKVIKLNCMMLKDPLKAFNEIAAQLGITSKEANPFLTISQLEQKLTSTEDASFYVIVVDEVDQIGAKDPELLCKLLALPFLPTARACVIGIANSIDLTERFLPRLKMLNCEPQVLHFSQYSIPDIAAILTDRLERINQLEAFKQRPFIDRVAIEFTARKVASTGDLRRALDMIRQSIDLAEEESVGDGTGAYVTIKHVAKIVDKFGSAQSGPLMVLKSLNLHQKVILAAFLSLKRECNNAQTPAGGTPSKKSLQVITPQRLFDAYCAASLRPPRLYEPVTRSEFVDLMSNLESMSVIGRTGQDVWGCKVYLIVPGELVLQMLEELATIKVLFGLV